MSSSLSHFDEQSGVISMKTSWGSWYQTVSEVYVEVDLEAGTTGKQVKVGIKPNKINCEVKGQLIFEGQLFDTIVEDESTWTVEDRKLLRIQLIKANPRKDECWISLMKDGQYMPDPHTLNEMRKKLDLEQFQLENPGFNFSNAKMDKAYDLKYTKQMADLTGQSVSKP